MSRCLKILIEGLDDSKPAKQVLRGAMKSAFDKVMDSKKVTTQILDQLHDELGSNRKYSATLNALPKFLKDKKLVALAKEQAAIISKLEKAKTVGDVRKISPSFVAEFERV